MIETGIFSVPGFLVGHAQDTVAATGLTVVLCPAGAVGGISIAGCATGSREIDCLEPTHLVPGPHALLLTGGSAFGLGAADGVMAWLVEQGVGFPTRAGLVPIVPAAVIFDLPLGSAEVRPGPDMARAACRAARTDSRDQGSVGAGCGATVGKFFGPERAMKGGLGTASIRLDSGLVVSTLAVVNAFGDVIDPDTGTIVAGARLTPDGADLADTTALFLSGRTVSPFNEGNTSLVVVATNARLDKVRATRLAGQAQSGLARCLRPGHSLVDGDLVVALAAGDVVVDDLLLGALAAETTARAVVSAVVAADGLGLLPAHADLPGPSLTGPRGNG
ncbi:MAG: P1 family peptidase [Proteobacteria bacterium]|nr:P1 family peptidase [Pseudomonadota bacterium]MBU1741801.1 P1 family peptidase [Pseudomonadota bacterium]